MQTARELTSKVNIALYAVFPMIQEEAEHFDYLLLNIKYK